jgi:DNA repair protein RadC
MTLRIRELHSTYRVRTVEDDGVLTRTPRTPREVATVAASIPVGAGRLADSPVECFGVLLLNVKQRIVGWKLISVGTLDSTLVHPREIFAAAIEIRAASIALIHNHPSGDPTPSPEDVQLARRMVAAGGLLGINVLDSIVVGHDGAYASLRVLGVLS